MIIRNYGQYSFGTMVLYCKLEPGPAGQLHFGRQPQEALVLEKRRKKCGVLLTKYMLEASLPLASCVGLEPEDSIMANIELADARTDTLMLSLT